MTKPSKGRGFAARATGAVVVVALGFAMAAGMTGVGAQVAPTARSSPRSGFDTCEAPPLETMRAWAGGASPYDTVGVYVGGSLRACPNTALSNPDWISSALAMGWNVIPIIVDAQAPCTDYLVRIDAADPAVHGWLLAFSTIMNAPASGLQPGDPIYLDLEPWHSDDPACTDVVREFIKVWAAKLRQHGYVPGLYSTASTGIAAVLSVPGLVDAVWVASWNDAPGSMGDASAPSWAGRRIHQYRGDHVESWGGHELHIDSNWIDGPVVRPRFDELVAG